MDIQMTICLAIIYIVFMLWGTSKKSGATSVNATPETESGYVNYFPDEGVDDDEEEQLIKNSSSSSIQFGDYIADGDEGIDYLYALEIESEVIPASVCVMIPDPWTIESELSLAIAEYSYQLPVAVQLALPPANVKQDVISVDYDKAEHHLMLSLMTLRQLKAEAKRVKLPKYGSMKKAELLSALKSFNTNA